MIGLLMLLVRISDVAGGRLSAYSPATARTVHRPGAAMTHALCLSRAALALAGLSPAGQPIVARLSRSRDQPRRKEELGSTYHQFHRTAATRVCN
jgi:hypothetical protein